MNKIFLILLFLATAIQAQVPIHVLFPPPQYKRHRHKSYKERDWDRDDDATVKETKKDKQKIEEEVSSCDLTMFHAIITRCGNDAQCCHRRLEELFHKTLPILNGLERCMEQDTGAEKILCLDKVTKIFQKER